MISSIDIKKYNKMYQRKKVFHKCLYPECIKRVHREKSKCCAEHRQDPIFTKFPKPDDCCVCTDPFGSKQFSPVCPLFTCGHWVCRSCIIRSGKQVCPLCQAYVSLSHKEKTLCNNYHRQHVQESEQQTFRELIELQMQMYGEMDGEIYNIDSEELEEYEESEISFGWMNNNIPEQVLEEQVPQDQQQDQPQDILQEDVQSNNEDATQDDTNILDNPFLNRSFNNFFQRFVQ